MSAAHRSVCAVFAALAAALSGCTQFPELDSVVSEEAKAAPEPELVDNRPLLAAASSGSIDVNTQAALQSRAAALDAKAAGLDGPVIPPAELESLLDAHGRLRETTARVAPDT